MAENDLDDFFAKKDKGKKKSKSKITPNDILAQGDEPVKKTKKKKSKPKTTDGDDKGSDDASSKPKNDDDEWNEFEDEEEKDYSGLRIQTLQVSAKEDDQQEQDGDQDEELDEDGNKREDRDSKSGPWNKMSSEGPPIERHAPVEEVKKEETPKPASTGKYIPPSRRAAMEGGSVSSPGGGSTPLRRGKKKEAPNIDSQSDFPTLGGMAAPVHDAWGGGGARFEEVRSGGRQGDDPRQKAAQLELGNKFGALGDE